MNASRLTQVLADCEHEIQQLSMLRLALKTQLNGHIPVTGPLASGAERPTFRAKPKRRTVITERGKGPRNFVRQVIAESRTPMTTKDVMERAQLLGWMPNPKAKSTPETLVYMALTELTKRREAQRVGTEWTRI